MTGGTSLSMLWEAEDPRATLRSRFGFDTVDDAVAWLGAVLRQGWAVEVERCDRVALSASALLAWVVVDGRPVVAKCSVDPARFARLAEVDAVVGWLHDAGFPVAPPLPTSLHDGRRRLERDGFSVGLAPCAAGDLLDVTDAAQATAAGRALAVLHRMLAAYPRPFANGPSAPGRQLVHGDFRAANVLQHAGRITAVLDFDEMGDGNRVADLAQAAVLLATRYHDWGPTSPDVRAAFVAAYDDVSPLTRCEHDDLERKIAEVTARFGW